MPPGRLRSMVAVCFDRWNATMRTHFLQMKGVDLMSNDIKLLGDKDMTKQPDLPAGDFSRWLHLTRSALIEGSGVEVPCGDCTACCTSSYFIHITPAERQTLTRIKRKLLFPAPGLPKGHVVLGYDKHGHCPMLVANRCSIYQQRPRTCRMYDCRLFAAAGIAAGDADKALINQRIRRWKFSYPSQRDRDEHAAVLRAARFFREHGDCFPAEAVPRNPSQLAILAIKVYDVFLTYDDLSKSGSVAPKSEVAKAIMDANEKFEARRDMAKV
jgi:Fe-S-cluster containining protein